jgi:hypothetical protein
LLCLSQVDPNQNQDKDTKERKRREEETRGNTTNEERGREERKRKILDDWDWGGVILIFVSFFLCTKMSIAPHRK